MASTPAVGPRPTTRTNTSAHTSSGTLRSTIATPRTALRSSEGVHAMEPPSAETERFRTLASASGTAISQASVRPAVAMATVRQVSRATRARNSTPWAGGRNPARKPAATLALWASKNTQGLNSVATSSGHSSTKPADAQNSLDCHAGSRSGARAAAACGMAGACAVFSGSA
jgi:hypothetical protein